MTKVAILIDGGYFLKRLPAVRKDIDVTDVQAVTKSAPANNPPGRAIVKDYESRKPPVVSHIISSLDSRNRSHGEARDFSDYPVS